MKSTLIFITIAVTMVVAQKPFFAPSGGTYPQLAPRFRDREESTNSNNDNNFELSNRIGGEHNGERIPIDALGDYRLVNVLKTWPREKLPFWYLNSGHIEAQRNTPLQVAQPLVAEQPRPFYAG